MKFESRKSEQPKVSIVVAMLNAEAYLRECLDSVIHQTLKEIEIICVDAGSTDGTPDILREYAQKDARIKSIVSDRKSYGRQMNLGIAAATGKYIGIVESDDYILPDMYETLYRTAEEKQVDFVKSDYEIFVNDGTVRKFKYAPVCKEKSDYDRIWNPQTEHKAFSFDMSNWTGLFRTSFVRGMDVSFNETPGASYQDNAFWFISFAAATRVCFVNKAFYMLRRDNPNSSVHSKGKVYCMCEAYDFIRAWLERDPERLQRFVYTYQYYRFGNYTYNLNRIAYKFKYEFLQRFSREYREAREKGELCKEAFLPNQWSDVNFLIDDMDGFFMHYYYNVQEEKELIRDMDEKGYQLSMALHEIEAIHASASYRIGRSITWAPRQARRLLWYAKTYGIGNVMRKAKEKAFKRGREEECTVETPERREPLPFSKSGIPRVSVVLAVKEAEKYLDEAIQSILHQTLKEIEIICVYDESTDKTLAILEKYAREDDRLSIVYGSKKGQGAARNAGIALAKGEYLICLDGDDVFELSMFEEMYRLALKTNAEVTVCQSLSWRGDGHDGDLMEASIDLRMIPDSETFNWHDCPKLFFRAFIGWAWDKLIKMSYLRENELRFGEYYLSEDSAFAIPAMARANKIAVLRAPMVKHRVSDTSLEATAGNYEKHWHDVCLTFTGIKSRLEGWGLYQELRDGYLSWVVHYSLYLLDRTHGEAHEKLREAIKEQIWPEFGVEKMAAEDFLYQEEREGAEKLLGITFQSFQTAGEQIDWKEKSMQIMGHYDAMRNSVSFRIGRAITWFPRKIRGGIRCLKENGLVYTLKRVKVKMQKIKFK